MTARETFCRQTGCGTAIFFLTNARTGKVAPIDVAVVPNGNIDVDEEAETYSVVQPAPDVARHVNHWWTCKNPPVPR